MGQHWHQHGADAARHGSVSVSPGTLSSATFLGSVGPNPTTGDDDTWLGDVPDQAYPVCGNDRVYQPRGSDGVRCWRLSSPSGGVLVELWHATTATFNGPGAYHAPSDSVLFGATSGTLYRYDAASGAVQASVSVGSAIHKAVALYDDHAYVVCANGSAHKVRVRDMAVVWSYTGGASAAQAAQSHPAVARSNGVVKLVYATADGYVHAVADHDGAASWRVKPYTQTWTSDISAGGLQRGHTFDGSWPVVAERHGVVLIRCQLPQINGGGALAAGPEAGNRFPADDAATSGDTIRTWFGTRSSPGSGAAYANLFAIDWDDGSEAFVPSVGYGSVEDHDGTNPVGVMGSQPVVKVYSNGDEVVYVPFRNKDVSDNISGGDYRWDTTFGEMVLDSTTVSGLQAGDLRFIASNRSYPGVTNTATHIGDEQCAYTLAGGDTPMAFHAHWSAVEPWQITDRSDSLGLSHASPIAATRHQQTTRGAGSGATTNFTTRLRTSSTNEADGRFWPQPAWFVYKGVQEPPGNNNADPFTYSAGMRPRYTFVHRDKVVTSGNGGSLFVLTHAGSVATAPSISSVADNRADYASSQVPAWSKLQVTCSITTAVSGVNPFFRYDPDAPTGIDGTIGITADCLFSDDDFATWVVMPMFYERVFDENTFSSQDWLYPTGTYRWTARFAPPTAGTWNYRIAVEDANGTAVSAVSSDVTVVASAAKGHVRISPTDTRYFEYSGDGDYFPVVGYNAQGTGDNNSNLTSIDYDDPVAGNTTAFGLFDTNGITVLRHFQTTWSVWGMNSNLWRTRDGSDRDGLEMLANEGQTADPGSGSEAAWKLTNTTQGLRTIFLGNQRRNIAVKPSTVYRIRARVRIPSTLVSNGGSNPGLLWLVNSTWVDNPWTSGGTILTDSVTGSGGTAVVRLTNTGSGWEWLTAYYATSASERWLGGSGGAGSWGYLYLVLRNCDTASGGQAVYVDRIEIAETDGSGNVTLDGILTNSDADQHLFTDQYRARAFDKMLDLAAANNVTLKLTVCDKGDTLLNCIDPATGAVEAEDLDRDNIYGGAGGNTDYSIGRVRWLFTCWWRYLQGRWGHSPAVHSWELLNEGENFNGDHWALAKVFGDWLGPKAGRFGNPHPTSASATNSYPRCGWNTAGIADSDGGVDFTDLHFYCQNPANFVGDKTERFDLTWSSNVSAVIQTDDPNSDFYDVVQQVDRLNGLIGRGGTYDLAAGPVWQGEFGLYDTTTDDYTTAFAADTGLTWLRKLLWMQLHHGGLSQASFWWDTDFFYDRSDGSPNNLAKFKPYADFAASLADLNSGLYVAAAATVPHADLRAFGQKDTTNGRVHLWIDHKVNRWKDVVDGTPATGRSGNVTVSGMPNGTYDVTWWNTVDGTTSADTATASGGVLTLTLPSAVSTDIAVTAELTASEGVTATSFTLYGALKRAMWTGGGIDFNSDTLKLALVTASYVPDYDLHEFFSDVTNEVSGTGYAAGGATLQNVTVTLDAATDRVTVDADNVTWPTSTITNARGAVLYKSTGNAATSPLIAYIDFGGTRHTSGTTFSVIWAASGLFRF